MNERGAASLNALRHALPIDGLLYLSVFGSQVKGTERPDSDLDALMVSAEPSCRRAIRDAITRAPGGVSDATVLPHTPETVERMANVYGSVEYGVLRGVGSMELYRADGFDIELHSGIDYAYSARRYLETVKSCMSLDGPPGEPERPLLLIAADCLLRASLLAAGVDFPWTRNLRALRDMLPPSARPPLDLGALEGDDDSRDWSQAEAQAASDMTERAYRFVAARVGATT